MKTAVYIALALVGLVFANAVVLGVQRRAPWYRQGAFGWSNAAPGTSWRAAFGELPIAVAQAVTPVLPQLPPGVTLRTQGPRLAPLRDDSTPPTLTFMGGFSG